MPPPSAAREPSAVEALDEVVVEVVAADGSPARGVHVIGVELSENGEPSRPRFALARPTDAEGRVALASERQGALYAAVLFGREAVFSTPDAPHRITLPGLGALVIDPRDLGETVECSVVPIGASLRKSAFFVPKGALHRIEHVPLGEQFTLTLDGKRQTLRAVVSGPTRDGETVVWRPEAPEPLVSGRVVDAEGAPVEGMPVRAVRRHARAVPSELSAKRPRYGSRAGVVATCTSGADGRFELFGEGLGGESAFYVDAERSGGRTSARSDVTFGQRDLELVLQPPGSLQVVAGESLAWSASRFALVVGRADGMFEPFATTIGSGARPLSLPPGRYTLELYQFDALVHSVEDVEVRPGAPCGDPRIAPLEVPLRTVRLVDETGAPLTAPTSIRCSSGGEIWDGLARPLGEEGVAAWIATPGIEHIVVDPIGFVPRDVAHEPEGARVTIRALRRVRVVLPAGERVDPNVTLTVTDLGAPPFTLPYTLAGDGTAFEGDLPPGTTFRGTLALFGTPLEGWPPVAFAVGDMAGEIVLEGR